MADVGWRKSPLIAEAKRVCQALNATAVIVIYIDDRPEDQDILGLATYGIDGPRCTAAGKAGDRAYAAVRRWMS